MTSTVRSVRVVLEADVAGYIASIRTAGHETSASFSGIEQRLGGVNREFKQVDTSAAGAARSLEKTRGSVRSLDQDVNRSSSSIDKYSGRLGLVADAAIVLAPALLPLGASILPAVTAGMIGMGAAVGGVGVAVLALQGLKDGIKALDAYKLDPTVQNLQKLRDAERQLGPEGTQFLKFLGNLEPQLKSLQNLARAGFLPGLEQGINEALQRLPLVRGVVKSLALEMGTLATDAGQSLSSSEWRPFFQYVRAEAAPTLDAFAHSVGNVALGLANLLVAFGPSSQGFASGLERMTKSFADWSQHLDTNQSFQHFLAYVQESGPKALALLGSLAHTFASVARAGGPIGQDVLPVVTELVKAIGLIADSPFGPALATGIVALRVYTRAAQLAEVTTVALRKASDATGSSLNTMGGRARFAVTALIGLEVAGQALQGIEKYAAGAAPNVEKLTAALISADKTDLSAALGVNLKDTLASLDPGGVDGLAASFENLGAKGGAAGKAVALGFGSFLGGDFQHRMTDSAIATDKANQTFQSLDSALTGLATTGGAARAQAAFDGLASAQGLTEAQQTALRSHLPGFTSALQGSANAAALTATSLDSAASAARSFKNQIDSLNSVLSNRASYRDYQAAIDDFTASLKQNGKTLDVTTAKGRANQEALDRIAQTAATYAKTLKGADRTRFLDNATKAFRSAAREADLGAQAAENLAERIHLVDKAHASPRVLLNASEADHGLRILASRLQTADKAKATPHVAVDPGNSVRTIDGIDGLMTSLAHKNVSPHVSVDPGNSFSILGTIQADINNLHGKTVTIRTVHTGGLGPQPAGSADGSTVPKGGPYRDRHLYLLAPGEEVISDRHGQATRNRPLLKAINAGRMADGGTVDTHSSTDPGSRPAGDAHHKAHDPNLWLVPFGIAVDATTKGLKGLKAELGHVQKAYDKEKAALDRDTSARDSLSSSVSGSLIHDPFGNGLAGFDAQVSADSGDIAALAQALSTLVAHGLSPKSALYQALAASDDVTTAQQLAALSSTDLSTRANNFQQRQDQANALGNTVGNQVYAQAIQAETRATKELRNEVKYLTAVIKDLPKHVEKGAKAGSHDGSKSGSEAGSAAGTQRGMNDRGRRLAAMTRTGGGA